MPDVVGWNDIDVGYENIWTRTISQEAINGYCDGVDDRNPWYGPIESPFGAPVAPPLFIAHWCKDTLKPLGTTSGHGAVGHVHARHRSEILHPVTVGTELAFRGTVVDKFERASGRYRREVIEVTRTDSGLLVHRDTREYLMERP